MFSKAEAAPKRAAFDPFDGSSAPIAPDGRCPRYGVWSDQASYRYHLWL